MTAHRAIIEAGPGIIRRLCCGTGTLDDTEVVTAALDGIDDPVVLVDARPVFVDSLWRDVLRSLDCGHRQSVIIVHPSWWAAPRVAMVTAAARTLADDVMTLQRSWLLAKASPIASEHATVVVEIADRFVVVSCAAVVAEPRRGEPHGVADAVARVVVEMTRDTTAAVVIDAPSTVDGAAALATMIADALRHTRASLPVVAVDDARLQRLAAAAPSSDDEPSASQPADGAGAARGHRRNRVLAALAVAGVALVVLTVGRFGRHRAPALDAAPTRFLVEGRVALLVPAGWPTERVVAGPGSARVQVTSPSDPEVVLHVTQSPVGDETLSDTAESLKRAIDAEPVGVFVDFNPSALSAGRPAVTYREVRAGHDIRWTVVLDRTVRISIGCQSRTGGEDAVRDVCDLAVRSARALR